VNPGLEILMVAVIVAAACALPGVFLVLRRMALLSDAISHSVLLGIVLGFMVTRDLASPWLVAAATAAGVATAALTGLLRRTRLVHNDAAIGLVYPALFSIAVILISRSAGNVHLDTDAVLLGEMAFAPFNRLTIAGADAGPVAVWVMGGILLINAVVIGLLYKELKITSFDPALAAALGLSPSVVQGVLMTLVSVTAVGAFDAVGSILVVALMIVPAAAALLLAERLRAMIAWSIGIAVAGAIVGYYAAIALDTNIAGSIATVLGGAFALALVLSPRHGLVVAAVRRWRQQRMFRLQMLAIHLLHHEAEDEAGHECAEETLDEHLGWSPDAVRSAVRRALREGLVQRQGPLLVLTDAGRALAGEVLEGLTAR
jgi:manganese/zinc/iron transport system permease protein